MRDGILHANNSNDVFQLFRRESTSITSYWANVDSHDVRPYLEYGTLPFMAALKSQALAFDQLERSIDRVLGSDVLKIGQFSADVMARIPQVLYAVADSDVTSLNSLSKSLEMPRPTLTRVFEALEKAEILFKLEANKPHSAQIRQPDKYLFTTPAIRAMYFSLTGSMQSDGHIMGRLMEDLVGMYLRRIFGERSLTTSINYGSGAGEADFVIRHRGKTYVIEVGFGAKTTRQVAQTSHVPENRIGIVVANETLRMDDRRDVVTVPIREFLLL